jgi:hypothetical protein
MMDSLQSLMGLTSLVSTVLSLQLAMALAVERWWGGRAAVGVLRRCRGGGRGSSGAALPGQEDSRVRPIKGR